MITTNIGLVSPEEDFAAQQSAELFERTNDAAAVEAINAIANYVPQMRAHANGQPYDAMPQLEEISREAA